MSEVKHTPGPWTWGEDHPQNACATVYGVAEWGQYDIAQLYSAPTDVAKQDANGVWGDHPERRANARLIAASPELLEAGRSFAALAAHCVADATEWRESDIASVVVTIGQLRAIAAAVAKAEGRE